MNTKKIALETCDITIRDLVRLIVQGEAIILTENDEPRYVLGAVDEFEWEVFNLSHNQEFMSYLDQARERARREGALSIAEARQRLKISPSSHSNASQIPESDNKD